MLQMLFVNKARELRMFTDYQEALDWLRERPLAD